MKVSLTHLRGLKVKQIEVEDLPKLKPLVSIETLINGNLNLYWNKFK